MGSIGGARTANASGGIGRMHADLALGYVPVWMQLTGPRIEEGAAARKVRAELEAEGYTVEFWSTGPGARLMGLYLEEDGLLFVETGSARLDVDERHLDLGEGDRVLVPAGSGYSILNQGRGPLSWIVACRARG